MAAEIGRGDARVDAATAARCFLCAYSARPCDVPEVEGRLLRVRERIGAGGEPAFLLECADGSRASILLSAPERKLAGELARLGPARWGGLRLRAFHLEALPRAPDVADTGGRPAADVAQEAPDAPDAGDGPADPRPPMRMLRLAPGGCVVVEPDLLLNITDINNAEYCVRQYPLRRMVPSPPTAASLRGTVVHRAFEELLKSGDRDIAGHLRRALAAQAANLALRQIPLSQATAEAEPHLRALAAWYARQGETLWGDTPRIRAETFLLAPEVGLRGRLDFLVQDDRGGFLLELKTGEALGSLPKRQHRWQVYGYQTLLAARRPGDRARPGATLLYSGTPGRAEAYGIPFIPRDLHRVLELRNLLALTHATGAVPPPPGGNTCGRCMLRRECLRASTLLGWEAPPAEEPDERFAAEDTAGFAEMYELLRLEARAAEDEGRLLWRLAPAERAATGIALAGLRPLGEPRLTASGEWEYSFACEHTSELREGDSILLSDGDPVRGAAVTGTILALSERGVTVWTPERIANPSLIDRYESAIVHDRTVRNLWRWLAAPSRLRGLVAGTLAPTFDESAAPRDLPPTLNAEQREAVARALVARDFLLIQGPPGTGKTSVVAEIARRAAARGERVLVAGFTNQAVDNVLKRLVADDMRDFVRLGHELSVAEELRPYRLAARARMLERGEPADGGARFIAPAGPGVAPGGDGRSPDAPTPHPVGARFIAPGEPAVETAPGWPLAAKSASADSEQAMGFMGAMPASPPPAGEGSDPATLREALRRTPLVASTAATWASEMYDEAGEVLRFDLALVDEATQLTVPALLGILRFADRFVLVGDERQLPPLVRSAESEAGGLKRSLFARLLARWGDAASVGLTRQYRMHPAICGFPSAEFYGGGLVAEGVARTALLDLDPPPGDPLAAILDPARPLVFVDVPPPPEGEPAGKASPSQAEVARRVVLGLRRAGVAAGEIGVIAPYRAQVAAIHRRLVASGEPDVTVDTVDRFQGAEREVIVFSFGGAAPGGVGRAGADFLADPHRLNVALTRARRKLVLIGDRRRIEGIPALRRLVEYCRALYDGRGGLVTAHHAAGPLASERYAPDRKV